MKKNFYAPLLFLIVIAACNSSDQSETETIQTDTVTETETYIDSADITPGVTNIPSLWKVELQKNNTTEKLEKPDNDAVASMAPQALIDALNESYPEIHLDLKKISHDTVYVAIPESERLTQQIGSTGAYNYMATAVYNLTELKNVKFVNFQFKEGDHASPGTYNRADFKRLR